MTGAWWTSGFRRTSARRDLSLTAALYRLDRTNTSAPEPRLAGVVIQSGAQRTAGWEVGASGSPLARWQIAGGYVNQVAHIMAHTNAAAAGARVPLVPRHTLSLWKRCMIVSRVGAGIGIVEQAGMFAAIDNTVTLPAFRRVDGALFVAVTNALRVQLNVENLFDRCYDPLRTATTTSCRGSSRMQRVSRRVAP